MYLEICRSFPVYGSAIFFGSAQLGGSRRGQGGSQRSPAAFVGVNSRGIHLINAISKVRIVVCYCIQYRRLFNHIDGSVLSVCETTLSNDCKSLCLYKS